MMDVSVRRAARWMASACIFFGGLSCAGAFAQAVDMQAGNLLAVLRESPGSRRMQESLEPVGKVSAHLRDGSVVEIDASWFHYVGDMHVRLVFDSEDALQMAMPEDLKRLKLSPEQAIALAVDNLRKRYGEPRIEPLAGGIMQVQVGTDPSLASSYFLDRAFWQQVARDYPHGIVVSVPQRGGLLFAPADDEAAMVNLQFSAVALFTAADRQRVSSALYEFKDGRWAVYRGDH